jgi:hypothetical protein
MAMATVRTGPRSSSLPAWDAPAGRRKRRARLELIAREPYDPHGHQRQGCSGQGDVRRGRTQARGRAVAVGLTAASKAKPFFSSGPPGTPRLGRRLRTVVMGNSRGDGLAAPRAGSRPLPSVARGGRTRPGTRSRNDGVRTPRLADDPWRLQRSVVESTARASSSASLASGVSLWIGSRTSSISP